MMIDQANRTFICSVVFVDLVGYSKKSVAEQISVKDRFTALLSESLKDIAVNDRIILDTGDGAAMSFLGDPEDALFVGMTLRDAMKDRDAEEGALGRDEDDDEGVGGLIRIGINLGPVKLVKDINGHPNIIGDGINVAQRIMSFAKPGQIVVSRSYFDVVSVISDAYAKLFHYEGSRTDKHVREHEIYVVGQSDDAFKQAKSGLENRAAQTNPRGRAPGGVGAQTGTYGFPAFADPNMPAPSSFFNDKKKVTIVGAALGLVILVLIILLATKKPAQPAADPAVPAVAAAPSQAVPAAAQPAEPAKTDPAPANPTVIAAAAGDPAKPADPAKGENGAAKPAQPGQTPAVNSVANPATLPAKTEPPKSDVPPATVNLAIVPWGEVFVNGKSQGVTPPKKNLKLAPGKYKIEIKNTTFAPHTEAIDVKSREEITIRHKFQ
jgi:class 3 adenylate cyclase